jgi:hypothetical protein
MRRTAIVFAILAVGGCRPDPADNGHGHSHAGGESWAVTAWGETYEVFPETDALAVGHEAESHVHVTVLDGFAPLREGRVSILLTELGGETLTFEADTPVRDGIYAIAIRPAREGEHTLAFRIEAPAGNETIEGGTVRVGRPADPGGLVSPPLEIPSITGEPVEFLKEQQWHTTFATQPVDRGRIRASVQGPARVRPAANGEVLLTAPFNAVLAREPWPCFSSSPGPEPSAASPSSRPRSARWRPRLGWPRSASSASNASWRRRRRAERNATGAAPKPAPSRPVWPQLGPTSTTPARRAPARGPSPRWA